jgi:hypothetical protein
MSKTNDNKETLYGKPWNTHSSYEDYLSACTAKKSLQEDKTLEVKIRRRSDNTFHIKTRTLKSSVSKKKTSTNKLDVKTKNRAGRRDAKKKREQEKKM